MNEIRQIPTPNNIAAIALINRRTLNSEPTIKPVYRKAVDLPTEQHPDFNRMMGDED